MSDERKKLVNSEQDDEADLDKSKKKEEPQKPNSILVFINGIRKICGLIVNFFLVQNLILLMIVVNSIMMGIATYDFVDNDPKIDDAFAKVDNVFLIIFTVELCLNFVHLTYKLFLDGWLLFDFITIVLSWSFSNFQVIRSFRVFRAFRLVNKIKVLRTLVNALLNTLPKMGAIISLMVLILFIFSVMFTSLFQETDEENFRNLQTTLFTLFQMMTLDWSDITRELSKTLPWAKIPIIIFVLVSGFIVYNLIVAVLCDAIVDLNGSREEEGDQQKLISDNHKLQLKIRDMEKRLKKASQTQTNLREYVDELERTLERFERIMSRSFE